MADPVEFGEEETAMLSSGKPMDELPPAMLEKMKSLNMDQYYEPIARNLNALLAQVGCR